MAVYIRCAASCRLFLFAREQGFGRCLVPMEKRAGGGTGGGHCLRGDKEPDGSSGTVEPPEQMRPVKGDYERFLKTLADYPVDFAELQGQKTARRAAEAAVAGMHNLLILGPQGSSKTMLSRRIPTIFPR